LAPFGQAVSEEKIFLTLANQKQELPLAASLRVKRSQLFVTIRLMKLLKKQMWPQSKLQFEYAGSKNNFDDLEFNLFVAGEL
jgi:hypothetical protein